MKKPQFKLTYKDEALDALVRETDQKTLALWAGACAERVLPYYENEFPQDTRPREALQALNRWVKTGKFTMATIRKASLAAHAAAREVGADNPARSAARAAGQAVAIAHVPAHALGAANYALQAVHRASPAEEADAAVLQARAWQIQYLRELREA